MAHWPLNWNVVRHDLVVGSCPRTPSDLDALRVETRVSAVLSLQHDDCLEKQEIEYPGLVRHGRRLGLTMERYPLRDFDPADQQRGLPAAVRGLWDLLRQGHRVYVHCTAGINRSPLVVLAYLTLVEGMSLEEAITLLLHARPEVCPTWEAYHGCRQELTARYADRIRQRAFECSLRQPESSTLDHWLQAERAIWREVLTAGSLRARPCCKPAVLVEHEHPVPQRDSRMSTDVNSLLDRRCEAFPACFDRSAPQPLKIGLGEELLALAGVHPALADLTRTRIRRALKAYTGAPAYRKALAASRI